MSSFEGVSDNPALRHKGFNVHETKALCDSALWELDIVDQASGRKRTPYCSTRDSSGC